MTTTRRMFASMLLAGTALTACANTPMTPAEIVADAATALTALAKTFAQVTQSFAIPPDLASQINGYLAAGNSVLGNLTGNLTAAQGAPLLQQVESAINGVISVAASLPLIPPPFSTALSAASVVLPIVEAWLNSVLPQKAALSPAASAARSKMRAMAGSMSVDQARQVLKQLAGR